MRALESELEWTFPAIKKQIDSLNEAKVLDVNKDGQGRAIAIKPDFFDKIRDIFFFGLKQELIERFNVYSSMVDKYYFGKRF